LQSKKYAVFQEIGSAKKISTSLRGWLNITKDVNLHRIENDSEREIYLEQVNALNYSI